MALLGIIARFYHCVLFGLVFELLVICSFTNVVGEIKCVLI